MNERDVLARAADLLENTGWCQDAMAMDREGVDVDSWDPEAVEFCAIGAVQKVCGVTGNSSQERYELLVIPALNRLMEFAPKDSMGKTYPVSIWNDHRDRTMEEVVDTMRRAAA